MVDFREFLRLLAEDGELKEMLDQYFMTCYGGECGDKLLGEMDYLYHKYLFTRDIEKIRDELKLWLQTSGVIQ